MSNLKKFNEMIEAAKEKNPEVVKVLEQLEQDLKNDPRIKGTLLTLSLMEKTDDK